MFEPSFSLCVSNDLKQPVEPIENIHILNDLSLTLIPVHLLREPQVQGYQVLHTRDGVNALQVHAAQQPSLVILDWMLPELDGLEVLRRIRQTSSTPVLMLTARGEETDRVVGLELGADDYLTKPFSMRELIARVRALLRRAEFVQ